MKVLIAGGGTGGHIYPGLSIVQELRQLNPKVDVLWVGTSKGLETKILPRYGVNLEVIPVGALNQVGLREKIQTLFLLPISFLKCLLILIRFRPRVVLGVGGYASGPTMVLSWILGFKTFLFEPNAHPGLTNRWLSRFVRKAFLNFPEAQKFFKVSEVVGIPVRSELKVREREPHSKFRILIFGGSQGARGINTAVVKLFSEKPDWSKDYEIVHQIGATDFQKFKKSYEELQPKGLTFVEYIHDMPEKLAWADLVVCRSGASTLAELAACGKAAILIPFPLASDNHQLKNALALEKQNAALVLEQKNISELQQTIFTLYANPARLRQLESNIKLFHYNNCAHRVAIEINRNL